MAFKDAFQQFPILETERLVLSELGPEDAETYHQQQKSALDLAGRAPWNYGFETGSADKARASFEYARKAWIKKARIKWGIHLKGNEESLIGQCELFEFAHQSKAEIGYWLGAAYQGQGLMTECLRGVIEYGFDTMGLHRIYSRTSAENTPSLAMLKKVGFRQEGILRLDDWRDGTWNDTALLAILRSDLLVSGA